MDRLEELRAWLGRVLPGADPDIAPASADASFRRYFRVSRDGETWIAMDAPPPQEDCRPYVRVAELFGAAGAHVPRVIAADLERGYLLLSDLGATTYLDALAGGDADRLYREASDALVAIQAASRPGVLPEYDRELLLRELRLFPDWYLARHLEFPLDEADRRTLDEAFERILACNLAEPRVWVHRDYHSRNLMVSSPNPGVLDFQDAVHGPISYDLASLFRDAYVEWQEERVLDWTVRHWEKARKAALPVDPDFSVFWRNFEWMGAQRQLKVLGIFARLWHRDGKDGYLKDMPLVMKYLRATCARYRELGPLARLLDKVEGRAAEVGYTF